MSKPLQQAFSKDIWSSGLLIKSSIIVHILKASDSMDIDFWWGKTFRLNKGGENLLRYFLKGNPSAHYTNLR